MCFYDLFRMHNCTLMKRSEVMRRWRSRWPWWSAGTTWCWLRSRSSELHWSRRRESRKVAETGADWCQRARGTAPLSGKYLCFTATVETCFSNLKKRLNYPHCIEKCYSFQNTSLINTKKEVGGWPHSDPGWSGGFCSGSKKCWRKGQEGHHWCELCPNIHFLIHLKPKCLYIHTSYGLQTFSVVDVEQRVLN